MLKIFFGQNKRYKNAPFFLSWALPNRSFISYSSFLYELKHRACLFKSGGIFHFRFRFVFIKVYFFVLQKAWTLWLQNVTISFKIKITHKLHKLLLQELWFLKVTSATKPHLLRISHLRRRLRTFLFRTKVIFRSQGIQVFVFLIIPWFTRSMTSWWVLVNKALWIFEYIFWTTTH